MPAWVNGYSKEISWSLAQTNDVFPPNKKAVCHIYIHTRWTDNLHRVAGGSWKRFAEDRAKSLAIGEKYVQQWPVTGDSDVETKTRRNKIFSQ